MDSVKKRIYISTLALIGAIIFAVVFIISRPSFPDPGIANPQATSSPPITYVSDESSYIIIAETYAVPWHASCNEVGASIIDPIISVSYPQIQGLADMERLQNINTSIENEFLIESLKDVSATCGTPEDPHYRATTGLEVTFEVKLQTDEFMSVKYSVSKNLLSGLRPRVEYKGYSVDLSDGTVITYKDILKADLVSRRAVKDLIIAALPENVKTNPDVDRDILDYDFHLTKEGIVFFNIFLSPASVGTEVNIPYEHIQPYLIS